MTDVTERLNHALRLARLGLLVFPLRPGSKEPYSAGEFKGKTWLDLATANEKIIRRWFNERPEMNYGVCPDERHVVVDLDVKPGKKDGVRSLSMLEIAADIDLDQTLLDTTFVVSTPSGGRHIYLRVPYPVTNANGFDKDDGIDVRGWRGYVVGPGCRLSDGREYVVERDGEMAEAPGWLLTKLRRPRERDPNHDVPEVGWDIEANVKKARNFLIKTDPAIEGDQGDFWTYKTALLVRDFAVSEDLCVELMAEHWNDRCVPPWDVYGERDSLEAKVASAYRNNDKPAGSKAAPEPEEAW